METLRRYLATIQEQMRELTPSSRWAIALSMSTMVLLLVIMLMLVQRPVQEPIGEFAAEPSAVAMQLQNSGIDVDSRDGQIWVARDDVPRAQAVLASSGMLKGDTSAVFDKWIERQTPWDSNKKHDQAFQRAKMEALSRIIEQMNGVESAEVMYDSPAPRFGQPHAAPTASAVIVMRPSQRVSRDMVHAVAGLVSGAVARMRPQDVRVVDANIPREYTVKDEEDLVTDEMIDLHRRIERHHQEKIAEHLSYIPGVRIAVRVVTDPTRNRNVTEYGYSESEPLRRESSREQERVGHASGGEAGARPNTGLTIDGGQSSRTTERMEERDTEFGPKLLTRTSHHREAGHQEKQINVSILVGRSYFERIARKTLGEPGDGDDLDAGPTEAQIEELATTQLAQIEQQVEPLLSAEMTGVVRASMIPDAATLATAQAGAATGVSAMLESPAAKPVGLVALSLLSLGIMLWMVRRETQPDEVPTAEELAGVPPKLPGDDELIGDADTSELSMNGYEIDEQHLRSRKLLEQIGEMIQANPGEAAKLVSRWVKIDD